MATRRPNDRAEDVSTLVLLAAIDEYGPRWGQALAGIQVDALAGAVGREIVAGNLYDGSRLTARGRRRLVDLRTAAEQALSDA